MIKNRGEVLNVMDQVNLTVTFKGTDGRSIDTDSYPTISIVQPDGLVLLAPTSVGVSQIGPGTYSYVFTIPINGPYGVFNDIWTGYVNGFRIETSFDFIVVGTQTPAINSDERVHLGDDPGFSYSECATINANKLLKALKARLNSAGKAKSADAYGNTVYVTCDIFSVDMLMTFIATSIWEFNQTPYLTYFNLDEDYFVDQFGQILVEGAALYALASQALIEKGRMFVLNDNGISFTPPDVGEMLGTQYSGLLTAHTEKLKYIKDSLRPGPLGLGVFNMQSSTLNPAIRRLTQVRARRIF